MRKLASVVLPIAACAALTVTPSRSQNALPGESGKFIVRDTGLTGIDLGLRDQDAPRDPAGRGTRGVALMHRANGGERDHVYLPGSVIVKFRSDASQSSVASTLREVHSSSIERPSYADFDIIDIPAGADPEQVCRELRERPDVEYAQPRYVNYPMLRPNDQFYDQQWNLRDIGMESAWDIQPAAGDQITVAVLDTGVAFRTLMLRYNSAFPFRLVPGGAVFPPLGIVDVPFAVAPELGAGKFVAPRDFIWDDDLPFDLDGHGTHVSGTVGQLTNNNVGVAGMAFNVRIMPVKVINETWDFIFGAPFGGTDDVIARGVRYAADNGAKVINMSIGRTAGGPATAVEEAIRYAISRGAFVAVAAGNSADEGNAPSRTAEQAPNIAGMVAVGAVGRTLQRAFYSTTNAYVEIAAPGGDLRQQSPGGGVLQQTLDQDALHTYELGPMRFGPPVADRFAYYYFQGTSMATPHVSAFAALLMQQGITKPAAVEAAMKQFARDLGQAGVDTSFGHGLIQPRATLRGLGLAK